MKVEIKNIYEVKKNMFSIHLVLDDFMEIRNVFGKRTKNNWFVLLPFSSRVDPKTKQKQRFPILDFVNKENTKLLINEIKKEILTYFKNREQNE